MAYHIGNLICFLISKLVDMISYAMLKTAFEFSQNVFTSKQQALQLQRRKSGAIVKLPSSKQGLQVHTVSDLRQKNLTKLQNIIDENGNFD